MKLKETIVHVTTAATPFLDKYQRVMVACSGHADSTALFHILRHVADAKKKFTLGLIHFNFGLRGEDSKDDQIFVEGLANKYGFSMDLRLVGRDFPPRSRSENLQNWARNVRRQAFAELQEKGVAVAVGHHQEDQAETVLMRLARGVGVEQLIGINEFNGGIWRPLLKYKKSDLEILLKENGWSHRHDLTNDKIEFSRNAIRHLVLPELERLYPGATERIVRTAQDAAELSAVARGSARFQEDEQGAWLDASWVREAVDSLALSSLVELVVAQKPERPQLSRRELSKFLDSVRKKKTRARIQLGRHGWLIDDNGKIRWKDQSFPS